LLYYDGDIVSTAKDRLTSVLSDLTTLENAQLLSNSSVLDGDVGKATHLINDASAMHDQASQIILQTPLTTSSSTTASTTPSKSTPAPRDLIQKSINDIKSAYQFFIAISTSIKTQLSY
jgi:hypothetical protein